MDVSSDKTQMSNAKDTDYKLNITAQLKDADGQNVEGKYNIERTSKTGEGAVPQQTADGKFTVDVSAVENLYTNSWTNITFKVTGADNVTGKAYSRNVVVSVKKLPDVLTNIDYKIEITNETADEATFGAAGDKNKSVVTTKLYATSNGLFAGYIGGNVNSVDTVSTGGITAHLATGDGTVTIDSKSAITVITGCAIFGTDKFDNGDVITPTGSEATLTTTAKAAMTFATVTQGAGSKIYVESAAGINARTVALRGTYTAKYTVLIDGKKKDLTKTFTVKNSYVVPKVSVESLKAEDINDLSKIMEDNLYSNVDMNDNESDECSITGLFVKTKNGKEYKALSAGDVVNQRLSVQASAVEDTINGNTWVFYVPSAATFVQK